jgi:hypothetical protein
MVTLKEYIVESPIDAIKQFIETDPYVDALKSEIAIYRLSPTDHQYIILIASRRLVEFIESLKGWTALEKNNKARPALKKNAFPLLFGSASLKEFMVELP